MGRCLSHRRKGHSWGLGEEGGGGGRNGEEVHPKWGNWDDIVKEKG